MKLKDAMSVVSLLVEKASGTRLDGWTKDGYMFNTKSLSLAFRVVSGKAKFPNLVKAWDELRTKYQGNTHIVVGFSSNEDIEPIVCMRLTTFLWYVSKALKKSVSELSAEIVNLEMDGCRKLGRV